VNAEVKARWISALRSGEFPQSTGSLRNTDGLCCLGVLCEIAEQDQVIIRREPRPGYSRFVYLSKVDDGNEETTVLPNAVVDWSGVEGYNPVFAIDTADFPHYVIEDHEVPVEPGSTKYNTSLATLNDDKKFTFDQIADVIEKYL
jgi:hypothetical protein